jgi:hypothetical protein
MRKALIHASAADIRQYAVEWKLPEDRLRGMRTKLRRAAGMLDQRRNHSGPTRDYSKPASEGGRSLPNRFARPAFFDEEDLSKMARGRL